MRYEFREAITQCSARKRGDASLSGMRVRRALMRLTLAPQLFLRPAMRGGKRGRRKASQQGGGGGGECESPNRPPKKPAQGRLPQSIDVEIRTELEKRVLYAL
jgi:hypothetical protein